MEHSSLYELITYLEYGTILHINVVFLNNYGNFKTSLPKKHTGKTMKEYVNEKRIKKSKELLTNTNFNITEIATRCGFNNVTYFNKLFKIYAGVSPVKYRNERHT